MVRTFGPEGTTVPTEPSNGSWWISLLIYGFHMWDQRSGVDRQVDPHPGRYMHGFSGSLIYLPNRRVKTVAVEWWWKPYDQGLSHRTVATEDHRSFETIGSANMNLTHPDVNRMR
jgi:hypothetical protein